MSTHHPISLADVSVAVTGDGKVRLVIGGDIITMSPDLARWFAHQISAAAYLVDPKDDEDTLGSNENKNT